MGNFIHVEVRKAGCLKEGEVKKEVAMSHYWEV